MLTDFQNSFTNKFAPRLLLYFSLHLKHVVALSYETSMLKFYRAQEFAANRDARLMHSKHAVLWVWEWFGLCSVHWWESIHGNYAERILRMIVSVRRCQRLRLERNRLHWSVLSRHIRLSASHCWFRERVNLIFVDPEVKINGANTSTSSWLSSYCVLCVRSLASSLSSEYARQCTLLERKTITLISPDMWL